MTYTHRQPVQPEPWCESVCKVGGEHYPCLRPQSTGKKKHWRHRFYRRVGTVNSGYEIELSWNEPVVPKARR